MPDSDQGFADAARVDPCSYPPGSGPEDYIGSYQGSWKGRLDCADFGMDIYYTFTMLSLELTAPITPGQFPVQGSMNLYHDRSDSAVEGTLFCKELSARFTIAIDHDGVMYFVMGTLQGLLRANEDLQRRFLDGTWQVEDHRLGCLGSGTWFSEQQ